MTDRFRRQIISTMALGLIPSMSAWSAPRGRRALAEGPRVSADPAVVQSGLGSRWQAAMSRDLGWAAPITALASGLILDQLEQGQTDAGLFLSHPKADALDKQGLIYERHALARTEVVLLGPTEDLAGIRSETDAGRALSQVIAAAGAGQARWAAPEEGSSLSALADQLTNGLARKGLGNSPTRTNTAPYSLTTLAQMTGHTPPAGTRIWRLNDPRLSLELQVALSFRSRHPAGNLLVNWLQRPLAMSIVSKLHPAWQRLGKG